MLQFRVIPFLLLKNRGLVKGKRFRDHTYVGDPINVVRIFNDKECDEIVFLDITATLEKREPDYDLIQSIAGECFMPFSYGGGINTFDQAARLFTLGVERILINSAASNLKLISSIAETYGSQSVTASVDVRKNFFGKYEIFTTCGQRRVSDDLVDYVKQLEDAGAGEIVITSIDRDGTGEGLDVALLQRVCSAVNVPVIISGGASTLQHLNDAQKAGASGVGAGSMFVFQGKHRAVLITYPSPLELKNVLQKQEIQ